MRTFLDNKKIKWHLSRRESQINKRNDVFDEEKLGKFKIDCYNTIDFTWEEALSKLPEKLETIFNHCPASSLLKIAGLMESSSIIPISALLDELKDVTIDAKKQLSFLLKELPLYKISNGSDVDIFVNFHQTPLDCSTLDEYVFDKSTNDEKENEKQIESKPKKARVVATAHKKKGQPSIVAKFPNIPDIITKFIKLNGLKAQDRKTPQRSFQIMWRIFKRYSGASS